MSALSSAYVGTDCSFIPPHILKVWKPGAQTCWMVMCLYNLFCVCSVPFFVICQRAAPHNADRASPYPHLLFPPSYPHTPHFLVITFIDLFYYGALLHFPISYLLLLLHHYRGDPMASDFTDVVAGPMFYEVRRSICYFLLGGARSFC